ncbi:MAG TPA: hypothetical protein VGD40_11520 [Chryseosolibacter sp.]
MNRTKNSGSQLADKLSLWTNCDGMVVAASEKALPLATVLAKELELPLTINYCTEIPDPSNRVKSIGSVSLNRAITHEYQHDLPQDYLAHQVKLLQHQLRNCPTVPYPSKMANKVVILVDSEIHTTDELLAAIEEARKNNALEVIVAAPTIDPRIVRELFDIVDEVFYLNGTDELVPVSSN